MRGLRQDAEGSQGAETVREAQALPLGFRMVRSEIRIRSLGRVHIGEAAYFVWALPPNVGGTAQRHPLCCSDMRLGSRRWPSQPREGEPKHLRQETCMDSEGPHSGPKNAPSTAPGAQS